MDPDTVIQQIADVDIQGATNVAIAGVRLLKELNADGASAEELDAIVDRLEGARPTEPMLHNAIRIARTSDDYDGVIQRIETGKETIAAQWQDLLGDGGVVYTHCHSSTVVALLTAAAEHIDVAVHVTETRPLYQGRTTAEELADAGIPVTMYVDSGARLALKDADVMLIGADAVTPDGVVTNKIGSELFAETAARFNVPVHVCTHSWKFDPRTRFGYDEALEQRVAAEVWPDSPTGVNIMNYAFEHIHPDQVTSILSELGQHDPGDVPAAVTDAYPALA